MAMVLPVLLMGKIVYILSLYYESLFHYRQEKVKWPQSGKMKVVSEWPMEGILLSENSVHQQFTESCVLPSAM
jgi:hypothetical protein